MLLIQWIYIYIYVYTGACVLKQIGKCIADLSELRQLDMKSECCSQYVYIYIRVCRYFCFVLLFSKFRYRDRFGTVSRCRRRCELWDFDFVVMCCFLLGSVMLKFGLLPYAYLHWPMPRPWGLCLLPLPTAHCLFAFSTSWMQLTRMQKHVWRTAT